MIDLEKGGRVDLEKEGLKLTKVKIGLGWRANAFDTGGDFDLDFSLFVLGENNQVIGEKYFIYYKNLTSPCGSIVHSPDDTEGSKGEVPAGTPAEFATIDLPRLPSEAHAIACIVTIYKADERRQNFGQVKDAFIRVYDGLKDDSSPPLAGYNLEDEFSTETAVEFGTLIRAGSGWKFKATGAGYKRGLADFVKAYGLQVKG